MKNIYTRAFDAVEPDGQKKRETIDTVIKYRDNKQAASRGNPGRRLSSILFSKRGIAAIAASFMLIVALSVGIPLGLNFGGNNIINDNMIVESLTVLNGAPFIEYEENKEAQVQLNVKIKYKDLDERNATSDDVTFISSDNSIATVDKNGLVIVNNAEKANIIIESKKKSASGDKIKKTAFLAVFSVSNVPSVVSLNTKVVLPKMYTEATPYVSVKYGGEDVKVASVDQATGYATGLTNETAEFNNEDKMFFYPTKLGVYSVEYYAVDLFGNKSTPYIYTITCQDRTAPILVGEQPQIPSEWGAKVFENDTEVSCIINFPRPQFVDNSGGPVTVSLQINDSEGKIVVYFDNIDEEAYTSMYYYGSKEFTQDGFEFDITKYIYSPNNLGLFTAVYTARDNSVFANFIRLSFEITFYPEYTKV